MPVQMELKRIIISEVIDHQMIWLKEVDGDRVFPIVIGIFEATSIDRRVKKMNAPRPLTHDLVTNVIDSMGGEFQDIYINENGVMAVHLPLTTARWGSLSTKTAYPPIVEKLNAAVRKIVDDPQVKAEWQKQGAIPMSMSVPDFDKYLRDDIAKWATIVKVSGAKPD